MSLDQTAHNQLELKELLVQETVGQLKKCDGSFFLVMVIMKFASPPSPDQDKPPKHIMQGAITYSYRHQVRSLQRQRLSIPLVFLANQTRKHAIPTKPIGGSVYKKTLADIRVQNQPCSLKKTIQALVLD